MTTWLASVLIAALPAPTVLLADENRSESSIDQVDSVMYLDPALSFPTSGVVISSKPIPLWLEALARSDAQLQRITIDTFSIAHRRGMKGIEQVIPKLVQLLDEPELDTNVQSAVIKALIEFDVARPSGVTCQILTSARCGDRIARRTDTGTMEVGGNGGPLAAAIE